MTSQNILSKTEITNSTCGLAVQGGNVKITGGIHVTGNTQKELQLDIFDLPTLIKTFKGRQEDIDKLDSLFFEENKKKIVICGLPGYGKSELAKQYANICIANNKIDKIFWIKIETKDELRNISSMLKMVYENYKTDRCLFIFDNGINRKNILDYEPPDNTNYYLLITSQEKDWGNDIESIKLDPLSLDLAVDVFRSVLNDYCKEQSTSLYEDLAIIVGQVPLGLQIIAGYIRQQIMIFGTSFNLENYVQTVKQSQHEIIHKKIPKCTANHYEESIYRAMKMSLDKLDEEDDNELLELAYNILFVCTFLNPDFIRFEDLLLIPNIQEILSNQNDNKLKVSLGLLANLSLINYDIDKGTIMINPLTQSILRYHLNTSFSLMKNKDKYFNSCMKFVFDYEYGNCFKICHFPSVMSHANDNVSTVYKFYKTHSSIYKNMLSNYGFVFKNRIILKDILLSLVQYGCDDCLKKIFKGRRKSTRKYIKKYKLLQETIRSGQTATLKMLLQYVDYNNILDENNDSLLHRACRHRNLEAIKILKQHKADINLKNNRGNIPLFEFVENTSSTTQHYDWTDILNIFNFKKDTTNGNNETLLHLAAASFEADLVEILIKLGLNVNQQDSRGRSPLHAIDVSRHRSYINIDRVITTAKYLIKHGALHTLKDKNRAQPNRDLLRLVLKSEQ